MISFLIALFSTGWLLPMWLAGKSLLHWINYDEVGFSKGEIPTESFPYVGFSYDLFTLGCTWLGLVIFFWAWRFSRSSVE
jgi:hypothetical protein